MALSSKIKFAAWVQYSVLDAKSHYNLVEGNIIAAMRKAAAMLNRVFVLDTNKQPLSPCHPARAKDLLKKGKASVYRRFPFTLILKEAKPDANPSPVQLKVDPGSKTTGLALVQDGTVIFAAELEHRGQAIKDALEKRRALRRGRRNRKTRYRQPRFQNRTRPKDWLAPSLKSRVDNLQTWFVRFVKLCNIQSISMELVRFDTQIMVDAEIKGVEYQQGELAGYEVREYLLEKWQRKCAYCGAKDTPLEIEHITPKSKDGSNRVSNLTLACHGCNQKKGSQTAKGFGFPEIQAKAKQPLRDAAAVNSVRWATWGMFKSTGLPVETGTGGRTKFNRIKQDYPKAHWIDAACVGESGESIQLAANHQPLLIKAMGRQSRQMCRPDKYGFPRTSAKESRVVKGFQTGDLVKAIVKEGKKKGTHVGRVAVRKVGSFDIGKVQGIGWKSCKVLHAADGYSYSI
ncbi:MAG: RNA-guided endonuclease IscB [Thiofilum sp.]|uniref:RNA-guided endonuclease IscB n=1 Tax=Thiofilum sp. TaxID=2212733 RepID=UPI003BAE6447